MPHELSAIYAHCRFLMCLTAVFTPDTPTVSTPNTTHDDYDIHFEVNTLMETENLVKAY